jgi:hypothetical protein
VTIRSLAQRTTPPVGLALPNRGGAWPMPLELWAPKDSVGLITGVRPPASALNNSVASPYGPGYSPKSNGTQKLTYPRIGPGMAGASSYAWLMASWRRPNASTYIESALCLDDGGELVQEYTNGQTKASITAGVSGLSGFYPGTRRLGALNVYAGLGDGVSLFCTLFLNGAEPSSFTTYSYGLDAIDVGTGDPLYMLPMFGGGIGTLTENSINHVTLAVALWRDKVPTFLQMRRLVANPWQLFAPTNVRRYWPPRMPVVHAGSVAEAMAAADLAAYPPNLVQGKRVAVAPGERLLTATSLPRRGTATAKVREYTSATKS